MKCRDKTGLEQRTPRSTVPSRRWLGLLTFGPFATADSVCVWVRSVALQEEDGRTDMGAARQRELCLHTFVDASAKL